MLPLENSDTEATASPAAIDRAAGPASGAQALLSTPVTTIIPGQNW